MAAASLSIDELRRLFAFFRAYDTWAHSPDGAGGDFFDAMVEARGELLDLFPTTESKESES